MVAKCHYQVEYFDNPIYLFRMTLYPEGKKQIGQDILGLGEQARMNHPSTVDGNWEWRLKPDLLTPEIIRKLKEMTEIYGRSQEMK